jgi:tetratricopeptide (TPR) repeat protein
MAIAQGDYDRAEQLTKEIEPRITGSRTGMIQQRNILGNIALTRGRVRESLRYRAEARERQAQTGAAALAHLNAGLDSVLALAVVLEDQTGARAMLERALRRAPIDSVPALDRDYGFYLYVAAMLKDTIRAREWHAASRRLWEEAGKLTTRPSNEALDDANLALALGRLPDALRAVERAFAHPNDRPDGLAAELFTVLSRMPEPDSAIAAGERYLAINIVFRHQNDALVLAAARQRLGELYEAKGNVDKALENYTAFVELWKNADPELQPRVRDVKGRIERLQRRRG